jgi:hypothetical protein
MKGEAIKEADGVFLEPGIKFESFFWAVSKYNSRWNYAQQISLMQFHMRIW